MVSGIQQSELGLRVHLYLYIHTFFFRFFPHLGLHRQLNRLSPKLYSRSLSPNAFLIHLFILLFRSTPAAYGGSQARGQIGAATANLHHSSRQRWILNALSKARDRTRNLMVPGRIC